MKIYLLFLALLLLQGCASKTPSALPPWQGEPVSAQFSARVVPQAAELPMQGGLRVSAEGGTLAVILQHGRTLGQCQIEAQPATQAVSKPDTRTKPQYEAQTLHLRCRVAEGLGSSAEQLLKRVALAAYRSLYHLRTPDSATAAQGQGWRVTVDTAQALQPLVYEDTLGTVHMTFSEVRP